MAKVEDDEVEQVREARRKAIEEAQAELEKAPSLMDLMGHHEKVNDNVNGETREAQIAEATELLEGFGYVVTVKGKGAKAPKADPEIERLAAEVKRLTGEVEMLTAVKDEALRALDEASKAPPSIPPSNPVTTPTTPVTGSVSAPWKPN